MKTALMFFFFSAVAAAQTTPFCEGLQNLDRYLQVAACDAADDNGVIKKIRVLQCVDDHGKLQPDGLISFEQSDMRGWMNGKTFLKKVRVTTAYSGDNVNELQIAGTHVDAIRGNEGFGSFDLKPEDNQYIQIFVSDAERTKREGAVGAIYFSKPALFKCSHIKSLEDIFGKK